MAKTTNLKSIRLSGEIKALENHIIELMSAIDLALCNVPSETYFADLENTLNIVEELIDDTRTTIHELQTIKYSK